MAYLWLEFIIFFIVDLRCSIFAFECSWMVPLTPAMMIMSGFTLHPCCLRVSIRGSYFMCLASRVVSGICKL